MKKKELIIQKDGNGNLIFDLNNINDAWNIVFIYEYIKNQWEKELSKINKRKNEIRMERLNTSDLHRKNQLYAEFQTLDNEAKIVDKYIKKIEKNERNVELRGNINFNDLDLQDSIKELKDAITAIEKIRNSVGHQNDEFYIDEVVNINNEKANFKVRIPIDYLDGFNKGRIIAKEEDKVIVEKTNIIISPLLEELDYDASKVESFFYNVEPSYLSMLLEYFNYDFSILYKLPFVAFVQPENTIKLHEAGIDVTKLNIFVFDDTENILKLHRAGIDVTKLDHLSYAREPKNKSISFELGMKFVILSFSAFEYTENILKLHEAGIDVTKLNKVLFKYPENTIKLYKAGVDVTKLNLEAFEYAENAIKLHKLGIDVTKIHYNAFKCVENTIKLHEAGIDVTKLPLGAFEYVENTIKLIEAEIDVTKLPLDAFEYIENTIKLHEAGIDVTKLPFDAFKYVDETIKLYKAGVDVTKLFLYAFKHIENILKLHEAGIDVTKLPFDAFKYPENTIKLIEAEIDVTKLPLDAFEHMENTIKLYEAGINITKLHYGAFKNANETIKLYKSGVDVTRLSLDAFEHIENTLKLYEAGINITKLRVYFEEADKILKLWNAGIDITMFPVVVLEKIFLAFSINNIKYLLNVVNNDYNRLSEFPVEFFDCDISLLDEMLKRYNSNIAKSIFGIDNPKIIAALVYCNNVLAKYNKNSNIGKLVNIDVTKFIDSTFSETYDYKDNIIDMNVNRQTFLNQFIIDSNGNNRSSEQIKLYILDKLRNSSEHLRFKPVKDNNGKILEDKVYLYDRENDFSSNNFNIIIDIKDLVSIVKNIEDVMKKEKEEEWVYRVHYQNGLEENQKNDKRL